ncbi:hypothetical protein FNF29_08254 [Cafeteria roenbergensis]|uniref:Uncharacterized protein n=1 Tax=Cafeteria roenbergensis TaxID=33653 RepID=A0A5A8C0D2_CAFRO|nr:hypothetical protein FNF29_08254 [Cafeteria roenbergensis]|eukprot:KAA0146087.1 hypothetical protein FNF29_08254 [Cafeteria roenbergensis]
MAAAPPASSAAPPVAPAAALADNDPPAVFERRGRFKVFAETEMPRTQWASVMQSQAVSASRLPPGAVVSGTQLKRSIAHLNELYKLIMQVSARTHTPIPKSGPGMASPRWRRPP